MTIAVIEQLEMIDIDHHQGERSHISPARRHSRFSSRSKPRRFETGKAVEARQLVEVLVGDVQFFFAGGELGRHVVERGRKRLELGDPGFLRGARNAGRRGRNVLRCAPANG